jgi:hypothetical protein
LTLVLPRGVPNRHPIEPSPAWGCAQAELRHAALQGARAPVAPDGPGEYGDGVAYMYGDGGD